MPQWKTSKTIRYLYRVTGHNGHKPKRQQPKRPQTGKATNRNGRKPKTGMATNRKGHRPKRPQTETATNRNGHRPRQPKTKTATNRNGHTRWYPNILQGTCMASALGLGLQGLYSATNCADNILGRFRIILQNQIARVDSFTNLTKRWVFRFRLSASISSHNLISLGKQFHARGPYTANARLPKVSCLNFGTFRTRSSLDKQFHPTHYNGCNYLSMLGLKLNPVSNRGPFHNKTQPLANHVHISWDVLHAS